MTTSDDLPSASEDRSPMTKRPASAIMLKRFSKPFAELESGPKGDLESTLEKELKTNRYDPQRKVLTWTEMQADAFRELAPYYDTEFGVGRKLPQPSDYIHDSNERLQR